MPRGRHSRNARAATLGALAALAGLMPSSASAVRAVAGTTYDSEALGWGFAPGGVALWKLGAGQATRLGPVQLRAGGKLLNAADIAVAGTTAAPIIYYTACRGFAGQREPSMLLSPLVPYHQPAGCDVLRVSSHDGRPKTAGFSSKAWSETALGASGSWIAVGRTRKGQPSQVLIEHGSPAEIDDPSGLGVPANGSAARIRVAPDGTTWVLWASRWQAKCGGSAGYSTWLLRLDPTGGRARVVAKRSCAGYGPGLDLIGFDGDRPLLQDTVLTAAADVSSSCWLELSSTGELLRAATPVVLPALSSGVSKHESLIGGAVLTATPDGPITVIQWMPHGPGERAQPQALADTQSPFAPYASAPTSVAGCAQRYLTRDAVAAP